MEPGEGIRLRGLSRSACARAFRTRGNNPRNNDNFSRCSASQDTSRFVARNDGSEARCVRHVRMPRFWEPSPSHHVDKKGELPCIEEKCPLAETGAQLLPRVREPRIRCAHSAFLRDRSPENCFPRLAIFIFRPRRNSAAFVTDDRSPGSERKTNSTRASGENFSGSLARLFSDPSPTADISRPPTRSRLQTHPETQLISFH